MHSNSNKKQENFTGNKEKNFIKNKEKRIYITLSCYINPLIPVKLNNLLTNEQKTGDNRNVDLQKNAENILHEVRKRRRGLH